MKKLKTMELHAALQASKDHTAQKGQSVVSIRRDGAYVDDTPYTRSVFASGRELDAHLNRSIGTADGWLPVAWNTIPTTLTIPATL